MASNQSLIKKFNVKLMCLTDARLLIINFGNMCKNKEKWKTGKGQLIALYNAHVIRTPKNMATLPKNVYKSKNELIIVQLQNSYETNIVAKSN